MWLNATVFLWCRRGYYFGTKRQRNCITKNLARQHLSTHSSYHETVHTGILQHENGVRIEMCISIDMV